MTTFKFPIKLNPTVKVVHSTFITAGYELYVVGGFVRDQLLGREGGDVDFATNATPEEMQKLFKRTIPTGIKHGTCTVLVEKDHYEVTTYRKEGVYEDGRRPSEVYFGTDLLADLERRDFTINAFAYDIARAEVVDPFEGRKDLTLRCMRTIGRAEERFTEDALRMMRACRLVSELNFTLDEACLAGIKRCAERLNQVSAERIRDEFSKLLLSDHPVLGIAALDKSGLLPYILPELLLTKGVAQNRFHAHDVYGHTLAVVEAMTDYRRTLPIGHACKDDITLPLAALLHDIAKPPTRKTVPGTDQASFLKHEHLGAEMSKNILKRLKFTNRQIGTVALLVREHMLHSTAMWSDGGLRRWIRRVGAENIAWLLALVRADRIGRGETAYTLEAGLAEKEAVDLANFEERIDRWLTSEAAFKLADLKIKGNDLMEAFSLKSSPKLGEILRYLLEKVLEEPALNTRAALLREAEAFLKSSTSARSNQASNPK